MIGIGLLLVLILPFNSTKFLYFDIFFYFPSV